MSKSKLAKFKFCRELWINFCQELLSKDFILQDYLSLKLPVNITRELTKLRLSSHYSLLKKVDILEQK
jgi:hypothetical protein